MTDDALSWGSWDGATFGSAYRGFRFQFAGTPTFGPGFAVRVAVRLVLVTHRDTPAFLRCAIDSAGKRTITIEGLEDDDRPQSLRLLGRGRALADWTVRHGGRPFGTEDIQDPEQIRRAVSELRREGRKVTRSNTATAMFATENALIGYHRRRGLTWAQLLADLES